MIEEGKPVSRPVRNVQSPVSPLMWSAILRHLLMGNLRKGTPRYCRSHPKAYRLPSQPKRSALVCESLNLRSASRSGSPLRTAPFRFQARFDIDPGRRNGVDIDTIRAWLGHVKLHTTKLYAEFDFVTRPVRYRCATGQDCRTTCRGSKIPSLGWSDTGTQRRVRNWCCMRPNQPWQQQVFRKDMEWGGEPITVWGV